MRRQLEAMFESTDLNIGTTRARFICPGIHRLKYLLNILDKTCKITSLTLTRVPG